MPPTNPNVRSQSTLQAHKRKCMLGITSLIRAYTDFPLLYNRLPSSPMNRKHSFGSCTHMETGIQKNGRNYLVFHYKPILMIIMVPTRMFYFGFLKYKVLLCNPEKFHAFPRCSLAQTITGLTVDFC